MAELDGYFWVYLCDDWCDGWVLVPKKPKEDKAQ